MECGIGAPHIARLRWSSSASCVIRILVDWAGVCFCGFSWCCGLLLHRSNQQACRASCVCRALAVLSHWAFGDAVAASQPRFVAHLDAGIEMSRRAHSLPTVSTPPLVIPGLPSKCTPARNSGPVPRCPLCPPAPSPLARPVPVRFLPTANGYRHRAVNLPI